MGSDVSPPPVQFVIHPLGNPLYPTTYNYHDSISCTFSPEPSESNVWSLDLHFENFSILYIIRALLLRWASTRPLNDISLVEKGSESPPGALKPIKTTPSSDTKIRYVVISICKMYFLQLSTRIVDNKTSGFVWLWRFCWGNYTGKPFFLMTES